MPSAPLIDLATVDLSRTAFDRAAVEAVIPQRDEMAFLDRVHLVDLDRGLAVGSRDIRADEFWVRGHIPGRPLLPGVLSLEALAQLCSFYYKTAFRDDPRFFGFGGVDGVKFRGTVVPGDRLILVVAVEEIRPRRSVFQCRAYVGDRVVVEAVITGLPV